MPTERIDSPISAIAPERNQRPSTIEVPQYPLRSILAVWAAAALPMAVLAWLVAPRLASSMDGEPFAAALIVCMTVGLIWQFALVLVLVGREQHSLRWKVLSQALWLRAPQSPSTGRVGGIVWLVVIPFTLLFAAKEFIPKLAAPVSRDFGIFLGSDTGMSFLDGAWGWFAVIVTMAVFNTVLGEELLFRGFLLPRMNGTFGHADWVANGILFAAYHLHVPWTIPINLLDTVTQAYATKRYRSAWIGIAVHSTQSVFIIAAVLGVVL